MRLTNIEVENILAARSVNIRVTEPVLLIAGKNETGKSSTRDAIAMALTGDLPRVEHKKDLAAAVSTGASHGKAFVRSDSYGAVCTVPDGKRIADLPAGLDIDLLRLCLNPERIAAMPTSERQRLIYGLAGVAMTPELVAERLRRRDCNVELAAPVLPIIPAGFQDARNEAAARARDEKAAWRTITGETYGEVKATRWKAPHASASDLLGVRKEELAATRKKVDGLAAQIAVDKERQRASAERAQKMAALREKAGLYARREAALQAARIDLAEFEAKLAEQEEVADLQSSGPWPCPACGAALGVTHSRHIINYVPEDASTVNPPLLTEADVRVVRNRVANCERDLAVSGAAATAVKALEDETPPSQEGYLPSILAQLAEANTDAMRIEDDVRTLERTELLNAEADKRTANALAAHGRVQAWDKIIDALSATGIPAELAKEALAVVQEPLQQAAAWSGWPVVTIDEAMEISCGGYGYAMSSPSKRWRIDAMLGYAVSALSGVRLMMLDGMDVLDIESRGRLVNFMMYATATKLDTAVVFATLKERPIVPEGVQSVWLENGVNEIATAEKEAA